jgi:hypothetical protein
VENNQPQPTFYQAQPTDSPLVAQRKNELLMYCQSFYRRSWDWRSQGFHAKWDRFDRNYESIYDPTKAASKEPWQSTMFVDITIQNCEIIRSTIHKTMMAPNPPIQTERGPDGDDLQARLIQDIMEYELRKADFDVSFYDALGEAVRYGSGFMKLYWERVVDTRQRRVPQMQTPLQVLDNAPSESLTGQAPLPSPQIQGFQMQPTEVMLRNQLCCRYVHIRDIFPEPNTHTWDKILHRDKVDYGTICRHIKKGEFFDVKAQLDNITEGERFDVDLTTIKQELGYFDTSRTLSKFEKKHTVWELMCPLPRKWIQFDMPEDTDEDKYTAEELVPGRVGVASAVALLYSEENNVADGEVNILKMDYIRTGQTYGKGICELVQDDQEELNEHANGGIDNISLIMNKGIAVMENALVNAETDLKVQPGWILRLKSQVTDDVRKAFQPIEMPDLSQSYFAHRFELERMVQEKTGASKITLGQSTRGADANQTLGGMELLRQMFNERIAAYGMIIESAFLMKLAQKAYSIFYQELKPEDLKAILGDELVQIGMLEMPPPPPPVPGQPPMPQAPPMPHMVPRYLAFAYPPPEVINSSYRFRPMGIFSLENKVVKDAQIKDAIKLALAADPTGARFNAIEALKYDMITVQGISEAEKWFPEIPMIPISMIPPALLPMIMNPQKPGPEGPEPPQKAIPSPQTNKKDSPGMKGHDQGNRPAFLPPNPLRREPVVQ